MHVIDDNQVIRENLSDAIQHRLPERRICIEKWDSAKAAADSLVEEASNAPKPGEVAICDLFDIDHYAEQPADEIFVFPPVSSLPGLPENVKRACLDNICRFFPPLIAAGLRIVVFSYVFSLLESEGDPDGATEVRTALREVGVSEDRILEKPEKRVDLTHLEPVANKVAAMIAEQ